MLIEETCNTQVALQVLQFNCCQHLMVACNVRVCDLGLAHRVDNQRLCYLDWCALALPALNQLAQKVDRGWIDHYFGSVLIPVTVCKRFFLF